MKSPCPKTERVLVNPAAIRAAASAKALVPGSENEKLVPRTLQPPTRLRSKVNAPAGGSEEKRVQIPKQHAPTPPKPSLPAPSPVQAKPLAKTKTAPLIAEPTLPLSPAKPKIPRSAPAGKSPTPKAKTAPLVADRAIQPAERKNALSPKVAKPAPNLTPLPGCEDESVLDKLHAWTKEGEHKRQALDLVRTTLDPVVVLDDNFQIDFHNASFLRVFGHKSGTFREQSLLSFLTSQGRSDLEAARGELASRKSGARSLEMEIYVSANQIQSFSGCLVKRQSTQNRTFFYLTLRQSCLKEYEQCREVLQRVMGILDKMKTHFWVTDETGRLLQINQSAAKHFGMPTDAKISHFQMAIDFDGLKAQCQHGLELDDEETFAILSGADGQERSFVLERQPFAIDERNTGWAFFARDVSALCKPKALSRHQTARLSSEDLLLAA